MSKTESARVQSPSRRLAPFVLVAAVTAAILLDLGGSDGRPLLPLTAFMLDRLLLLIPSLILAGVLLGAILGYGLLVIPSTAFPSLTRTETALLAFGSGSGLLSVLYLFCALSGYASPVVLVPGLLLLALGARRCLKARFLVLVQQEQLGVTGATAVTLVVAASLLLFAGALTPPLVYDVTEYHLGAYTDYLQATPPGRIVPVPHNFYARFPFPVEALYHLALQLSSQMDTTPKLLNAAFVAASALLVAAALRRSGTSRPWRVLAALLVLAHPVMLEVSLDAYIDAPVAFLTAAAAWALYLAGGAFFPEGNSTLRPFRPGLLPAGGLLLGTALSSKYTVAQLYLLPLLLFTIGPLARPVLRDWCRDSAVRRQTFWALVFFFLPLLAWLGKNVLFYGNPLAPFFHWVFQPENTEAIRRERFYIESHFPQPFWTADYWQTLPRRIGAFWWMLLAPLAGVPFLERAPRRRIGRVLLFALLVYLLWNMVRESQARFLLPAVLLLTWAVGETLSRIPAVFARRTVAWVLLAGAGLNLTIQAVKFTTGGVFTYLINVEPQAASTDRKTVPDARLAFYEQNLGPLGDLLTKAHTLLPDNARLLLVYEARPYLFRPWPTLYNTVWDESPLFELAEGARTGDEIAARLHDRGFTHLLVNEEELRRLIEQYARPTQLRQLGLSEAARPHAWYATSTPEDLYPPFWRSRNWPRTRAAVLDFLRQARDRAIAVEEVRRPGLSPIRIWLSEVQ